MKRSSTCGGLGKDWGQPAGGESGIIEYCCETMHLLPSLLHQEHGTLEREVIACSVEEEEAHHLY